MKPRRRFFFLTMAAGMLAVLSTQLGWAQDASHTRIVRLSFAEGDVTVRGLTCTCGLRPQ